MDIRKTKTRTTNSRYSNEMVIRVAKNTQAYFIVSSLIVEKLGINTDTEALMFSLIKGKLTVKLEPKEDDNYHLSNGDTNTYRFRSIELYNFVSDFFKIDKDKHFFIKMDENFIFNLA